MIRYAQLPLSYDIQTIRQEVSGLLSGWLNHFNTRDYSGTWTVLPLRSPGGSVKSAVPDLIFETAYADTVYMQQCPVISALVSGLQCKVHSARLLNLQKGSIIKEHRDAELAFEMGQARLHFPIFTNPDVAFYVDGRRVIMDEGTCWYINANRKHHVNNQGTTDRIHLVIDCAVNDWLKETLFGPAQKDMVSDLEQMEGWEEMIASMRKSGEQFALELADRMEAQLTEAQAKAALNE